MAETSVIAKGVLEALPSLLRVPAREFEVDYDKEADVLYVSFRRPQGATDTREEGDGVLVRYNGDEVVGVTVLNASRRPQAGR